MASQISKSIRFPVTVVDRMDAIAKDLGFVRYMDEVEVANVSEVVQRAVLFMLDNPEQFKKWIVSRGPNGSRK